MTPSTPSRPPASTSTDGKKTRAKQACRVCNSRRVRCNVMQVRPCDNCVSAGEKCEIVPSRRGRYPRRSRRGQEPSTDPQHSHSPHDGLASSTSRLTGASPGPDPSPNESSAHDNTQDMTQDTIQDTTTLRDTSPSPAAGTLFFGESNFLTLVPGSSRQRLMFPAPDTPQSQGGSSSSHAGLSPATMQYLRDEGAFTLPDLQSCVPALQAYFAWFHPCFPVVDRGAVLRQLAAMDISRMLLQAMLYIGATYCDDDTIAAMGFADRSEAKNTLYGRARILFHADWEKDRLALIQSLFLMSFWRGGPSDVRDVRYWLGVVITLAESYGLHRSDKFMSKDPRLSKMRRRIWWSIYVRERQAAASLGLPSRIRDEDCDIEPLAAADLESETEVTAASLFGSCEPQHITYVVKMVEIARLLGRVIDVQFVPGQRPTTSDHIDILDMSLEEWKRSLPSDMQYSEEGTASIWTCLLHLAYNHIRILIHRSNFIKYDEENKSNQVVVNAACRISRIAEDMSAQGTLRYGQMHLITSLFAALCIHALGIRRHTGMSQRIAEHRAQLCLLCLKEIQKYWRVNNNVLDLFLQYLDSSIAKRLHGGGPSDAAAAANNTAAPPPPPPPTTTMRDAAATAPGHAASIKTWSRDVHPHTALMGPTTSADDPNMAGMANPEPETHQHQHQSQHHQHRQPLDLFEDQYLNLVSGHWEGDDALGDLAVLLGGDEFMQTEGMDFLGRSL